jgi:hypothetical protein
MIVDLVDSGDDLCKQKKKDENDLLDPLIKSRYVTSYKRKQVITT